MKTDLTITDRIRQFRRTGYTILPGYLTPQEITDIRERTWSDFSAQKDNETEIKASELLHYPAVLSMLLKDNLIEFAKSLFGGPFTLYPNIVLRINRFTTWHVDN